MKLTEDKMRKLEKLDGRPSEMNRKQRRFVAAASVKVEKILTKSMGREADE